MEDKNLEHALKYQIKRQSNKKENVLKILGFYQEKFFNTIKASFDDEDTPTSVLDKISLELWELIEKFEMVKKQNSSVFGVKTTIGFYTSKKGKITPSHFTKYGNYLGSVKVLGEEPIDYDGNFPITKKYYRISYIVSDAKIITDFFVLK